MLCYWLLEINITDLDIMELVKIAKSNLRSELKKKLSQMSVFEIAEQSKIITDKVSGLSYINTYSDNIFILYVLAYFYLITKEQC